MIDGYDGEVYETHPSGVTVLFGIKYVENGGIITEPIEFIANYGQPNQLILRASDVMNESSCARKMALAWIATTLARSIFDEIAGMY